ncbi:hypothetical protein JCM8547_006509 [Rhodosporidiobolus lusitaniae]
MERSAWLPPELLAQIFGTLTHLFPFLPDAHAALARCCRVSKAWEAVAREELYRQLNLSSYYTFKHPAKARRVLNLLEARPDLARLVKTVEIDFFSSSTFFAEEVGRILAFLPSVTSIESGSLAGRETVVALAGSCSVASSRLRRLDASRWQGTPIAKLLCTLPALEELNTFPHAWPLPDDPNGLPPPPSFRLRRLTLPRDPHASHLVWLTRHSPSSLTSLTLSLSCVTSTPLPSLSAFTSLASLHLQAVWLPRDRRNAYGVACVQRCAALLRSAADLPFLRAVSLERYWVAKSPPYVPYFGALLQVLPSAVEYLDVADNIFRREELVAFLQDERSGIRVRRISLGAVLPDGQEGEGEGEEPGVWEELKELAVERGIFLERRVREQECEE